MLKKLIKNELKQTCRVYAVIYAAFTVLMIAERLSLLTEEVPAGTDGLFAGVLSPLVIGMLTTLTVLGVAAMWAAPVLYGIYRFYKNMLTDEGYLTMTLPVTVSQHLWSKLIVSCIWQLVTILLSILLGGLFLFSLEPRFVQALSEEIGTVWQAIAQSGGGWAYVMMALLILSVLTRMAASYLTYFSAMSIGQCANKHKFLLSVGIYAGFQMAATTVWQLLNMVLYAMGRGGLLGYVFSSMNTVLSGLDTTARVCQTMSAIVLAMMVLDVMLGLLHFLLSRYFLTKKLNLA